MESNSSQNVNSSQKESSGSGGRLYWLYINLSKKCCDFYRQHRLWFIVSALALLSLLIIGRAIFHPLVIASRRYVFALVLLVPIVFLVAWQLKKREFRGKLLIGCLGILLFAFFGYAIRDVHHYLELYVRYLSLEKVDLEELPISDYERIQPRNSIFSLAHEVMTESESPLEPDFVRIGKDYRWTMGIEPAYPISRVISGVSELYDVSATAPSPSFAKERRIPVSFQVSEDLLYGRNSRINTIRSFGLWRYLNYEPADVIYFTDDEGQWVQVVSLIRWRGLLFPRPEFGGVQLIRQEQDTVLNSMRRMFIGSGEWIAPKDIGKYEFLKGQNLLSYTVSRHIANSFRFQNGFLSPFPFYHVGDIRIPDMAADVNDQPFTGYFILPGESEGSLYHYFALEPFDPTKQGLNTSLFLPADGSPFVHVYRHHDRSGSLTGVSAISAKVMESKKNYDWSRNRPVEHRPFIRDINGVRRFFWLTTVVTLKEGEGDKRFIAGTVPDVVLTDAAYSTPVWVNALAPESWLEKVKSNLSAVWGEAKHDEVSK